MTEPVDDVDRVMAVMARAFDPAFGEAWTRRQIEDALLIANSHLILTGQRACAPDSGEPAVGFALSRHGYEEEELLLLAVLPEFRNLGLGRYLVETLKNDAAVRGARRLLLEMREGNSAQRLYKAAEFDQIGTRVKYYQMASGDRIDAITYACDIQ